MTSSQETIPKETTHNNWLDICRGLAIMLVLLSHGRTFLIPIDSSFQFFKFGGFLGVELFFVLSGFLIGSILIDKFDSSSDFSIEVPRFWIRRWLRTYPSYLLFICVNYVLLAYGIRMAPEPSLLQYLTFTQALLTPHGLFFGEAWSLAIEELFYFIAPLLIVLLSRIVNQKSRILLATCIVLFVFPLLLRVYFTFSSSWSFNEFRSTTLLRIDSIIIGVMLSWIMKKSYIPEIVINRAAYFLSFIFLVVAFLATKADSFFDHAFYKIFFFPIADLGCAGIIALGLNFNIGSAVNTIFSFLAKCSYSAYLINIPVIVLFQQFAWSSSASILPWLMYILVTLSLSWLLHHGFEKRILTLRDKLFER